MFYSLSLRRKSGFTALILGMKAPLSLRFWWGILQLSESRILRYTSNHHHITKNFIAIFWIKYIYLFFILCVRLFWLRLPLCHRRRAVMAPTQTGFVSLGQTSCRKAQHRTSGTGWKLCVLNHTTRSEHSHLKLYVKYSNICIMECFATLRDCSRVTKYCGALVVAADIIILSSSSKWLHYTRYK